MTPRRRVGPNDDAPRAPRLRDLLLIFTFTYLLDYALTLTGTSRPGFHELNPIAGHLWNTGQYVTPLLLKLAGLSLLALLVYLRRNERAPLARRTLQAANLLFCLVNVASLTQLSHA